MARREPMPDQVCRAAPTADTRFPLPMPGPIAPPPSVLSPDAAGREFKLTREYPLFVWADDGGNGGHCDGLSSAVTHIWRSTPR